MGAKGQQTFAIFMLSKRTNAWVYQDGINIYVRKRRDGSITLANMEADVPGNGALTRFLNRYEPNYTIWFELIYNERLQHYLVRRGYTLTDATDAPDAVKLRGPHPGGPPPLPRRARRKRTA